MPGQDVHSLEESEAAIETDGEALCHLRQRPYRPERGAFLDPSRPFVLISNDEEVTERWRQRGFRVIHGDPAKEAHAEESRRRSERRRS